MPRDLVHAPDHSRNRSLGWLAVDWMEAVCVHGPGDIQGRPLDPDADGGIGLDDELIELTLDCYALDENGRRLYDSAFVSRAKGRDKSGHAGRMALFEAFGPCRFAGWAAGGERYEWRDFVHIYQPGEPMGRPVIYPFVRCLATEENQSGNTYDNILYNLTDGPLGEGLSARAAGVTGTVLPRGGEIVPSTASDAAKDGGKESFVVFDETHLYITPELRRMYRTVRRNLAKRRDAQPWSLETSTMYQPGENSVAEESHKTAEAIREGRTRSARLLFDHRYGPPDTDLADEAQLRAALAEAYGPFAAVMDLDRILDEIWDPRNTPEDSRRFFLNVATAAADAWVAPHEWEAARTGGPLRPGDTITLGFDGSRSRARGVTDATALIGCRVADGHLVELGVWEQPPGPAGLDWQVPVTEVLAAVDATFDQYQVVGFYADPAKWESHVVAWEARHGAGLAVRASRSHPIEWWMTGGRSMLIVRALEQFHSAVLDRELTHDGAWALTRHVLAARRRPSRSGMQIAKEHPDSPRKIDAAVAAVLAWQARLDALAAGVGQQPMAMGGWTF